MGSSLVRLTIPDQESPNNVIDEDVSSDSESMTVASNAGKSAEQNDTSKSNYARPAHLQKDEGPRAVGYNFPSTI